METQSKNLVVKSNRLIEAGYRLTLQEQRVILLCITKIKPKEHLYTKVFSISAAEYAEKFGIKLSNAYKELKQIIDTLYNRNVKIYDKEANVEGELRWVQKKLYFNNEGYAEITLTDDLLPLLSELKSAFTSYNLDYVAGMKSIYAIRMYELFKQFGSIGKRRIGVDWLKERLQIENLYPAFADLKRRVVDPALKEINGHSDLSVNYSVHKEAKRVISLDFIFSKKIIDNESSRIIEHNPIEDDQNSDLIKELKSLGVSDNKLKQLIDQYDKERILRAIELTRYNIETKQIKKTVTGFLVKAIEEEYSSYEIIKKKEIIERSEESVKNEDIRRKKEEKNNRYKNYIYLYTEEKINSFSLEEKNKQIELFLKQADKLIVQYYVKNGIDYRVVYSAFVSFIKNQIKNEFMTEEEFYKNENYLDEI